MTQIIISGIFFLVSYVGIMNYVLKRLADKRTIPMVGALLFFCCLVAAVVVWLVISLVAEPGVIMFMAVLVAASLFFVVASIFLIKNHNKLNRGALLLLFIYTAAVITITLAIRDKRSVMQVQMTVFSNIRNAIHFHSFTYLQHGLLNVALFFPFGLLLPWVETKKIKTIHAVMAAGAVSAFVEMSQAVFRLGICDIDDVGANMIGAWLGAIIYRFSWLLWQA